MFKDMFLSLVSCFLLLASCLLSLVSCVLCIVQYSTVPRYFWQDEGGPFPLHLDHQNPEKRGRRKVRKSVVSPEGIARE